MIMVFRGFLYLVELCCMYHSKLLSNSIILAALFLSCMFEFLSCNEYLKHFPNEAVYRYTKVEEIGLDWILNLPSQIYTKSTFLKVFRNIHRFRMACFYFILVSLSHYTNNLGEQNVPIFGLISLRPIIGKNTCTYLNGKNFIKDCFIYIICNLTDLK